MQHRYSDGGGTQNMRRRRVLPWMLAGVGVLCLVLAVGGYMVWRYVSMPFSAEEPVRIYIPGGASCEDIRGILESSTGAGYGGRVYMLWKKMDGTPTRSHGSYVIDPGMSAVSAARMILQGRQTPVRLTFNNIRLMSQLAARVGRVMEADSAGFMAALTEELSDAYSKAEYPAAFVPDTYEFYWTAPASDIVDLLVAHRNSVWTPERQKKAETKGLTPVQVATVASIVEEETVKADERPKVAALYLNRLKKGMKLQADPTVKYAIGDFSLRRITGRHLAVESPYNTYRIAGLPPGPIRIPELSAIDAVLDAPATDNLYMCAREDFSGYHNFTSSYARHLENARRYQAALDRRGIK